MTSECICPRNLEQLLMIEYPGFVKNVDKALDTLGGIETLNKVSESQKERLELKFRKSDPLAHSACGDRVPKKALILRIKRSKDTKSLYSINIVGKIQTAYRFDTMAEFQWLPMARTNQTNQIDPSELTSGVTIKRTNESLNPEYASILDDILPIKNPFDNSLKNFNPDAPLLLLPAIFSRFDTPRGIYQPHPKFRSKEMRDEYERQQSLSIIGRTRKKRSTMSHILNFGDPIPEGPPDKLVAERGNLSSSERSIVPKLQECFERQKVWSKAALCYELECPVMEVKYTLPLVAFYCQTGPFRTMWIKYGYDPHKDNTSKILQALDFRVKNPTEQQETSRRSIYQYQLPLRKNPERAKSSQQLDLKSVIQTSYNSLDETLDETLSDFKNMAIPEALCKFRRDLVPPARQLSYLLKDIELEEVQVIVHSNDGREPDECSERDGWLPAGSIDRIRKIMSKSLRKTVEQMTTQLVESL